MKKLLKLSLRSVLLGLCLLYTLTLPLPGPAYAITIDEFQEDQSITADGSTPYDSSTVAGNVLGGFRSFETETSTKLAIDLETRDCLSQSEIIRCVSHSQNSGAIGVSKIVWDGDATPGLSDFSGLRGIDLTEDGATAFVLKVIFFDYPASQPLDIEIRVYDARDPSGATFVSGTLVLDHSINGVTQPPEDLELHFADMQNFGGQSVNDIVSSAGAISLSISGLQFAYDLDIALLKTNGLCSHIPNVNESVVDECGVCAGDNSSCLDCEGVPNGSKDVGAGCNSGNVGICQDGKYNARCECEAVQRAQQEVCDGLDNDCDGQVDEIRDYCGVCGGDGSTCCVEKDQTSDLRRLDGGAKRQERAIKKLVRYIKGVLPRRSAERKSYRGVLRETHQLQVRNWTISWQLPHISSVCEETVACATSSNLPILDEYRVHNKELWKIFKRAYKHLKTLQGMRTSQEQATLRRYARKLFKDNLALANSIPTVQFACS